MERTMTDLRNVDVNLIVVLDAILAERSLTKAGESIGMTQPAVSGALGKLRKLLDDPLLVRNGRTFDLTPKAKLLQPMVAEALREVGRTFNLRPQFDPLTSDRRFRIWASDYVLATMTSPLLGILEEEAPGTSVEFGALGLEPVDPISLLRADVVISSSNRGIPGKRQALFSDSFVCIISKDHPRLGHGGMTLNDLAELPFVRIDFGEKVVTVADEALATAGLDPHIAMSVTGFLTAPFMIQGTDMWALVPGRVAELYAEQLGLVIVDTPVPRSSLVEVVYWHPSKTSDPALRWLVAILRKTAERVEFANEDDLSML
jgi:DNA-binding transcriptional LysR family regulator